MITYETIQDGRKFGVVVPQRYCRTPNPRVRGDLGMMAALGHCYCAGAIAAAKRVPKSECPFTAAFSAARWQAWNDGYDNGNATISEA